MQDRLPTYFGFVHWMQVSDWFAETSQFCGCKQIFDSQELKVSFHSKFILPVARAFANLNLTNHRKNHLLVLYSYKIQFLVEGIQMSKLN
jgi:hypothetical protein